MTGPVAYNPQTGAALRLGPDGQWMPTDVARNDATGEVIAFDGAKWSPVQPAGAPTLGGEATAAAAGFNRGLSRAAGMPVDLMTGALNAGAGAINSALGTELPTISDPVGGSASLSRLLERLGISATPDARTQTGRIVARAAEEVGAAVPMMMGGAAIPAGALGARLEPIRQSVAGTGPADRAAQLLVSAGAGAGAGALAEADPAGVSGGALAGGTGGAIIGGIAGSQAPTGPLTRALMTGAGAIAGGASGAIGGSLLPASPELRDFAGAMLGGGVTAAGLAGGAMARDVLAPFVSPGSREAAAGYALRRFSADPDNLATRLATAPGEVVPGSPLTTAQAAQDPGLAVLERTVRTEDPQSAAAFALRDAQRSGAQRGALDALAPAGPGSQAVADMVRGRVEDFRGGTGAILDRASGRAGGALDAVGPGRSAADAGAAIRGELASGNAAMRAAERAAWDAVDPGGALALDARPIRDAASSFVSGRSSLAAPLSGEVGAIVEAARALPDTLPFRDLQALRSRTLDAIRTERMAGNDQAVRALEQVRGSIDLALDATGREAAPGALPAGGAASGPAAGIGASGGDPAGSPSPSSGSTLYTPSGREIGYRWELVEGDALVTSHDAMTGRPNPSFPTDLQPRDRTRAASDAQIAEIAGKLDPRRLGASLSAADGAPVVGPDNLVESGNGRTAAILRAQASNTKQGRAYRDWLREQGFDPEGMRAPVLIRRRTTDLSQPERTEFARDANTSAGMSLSAAERAKADARNLGGGVLDLYKGGDLTSADNRDFVRAFVRSLPKQEAAGAVAADGTLAADGLRRLQGALLARAYGDDALLGTLLESGDDGIRAIGRALVDGAPKVARLRAAVEAGDVGREFDPVPALVEAVRLAQRARSSGMKLGDLLNQSDAFASVNPDAAAWLRIAYGDDLARPSAARLSAAISAYAEEAGKQTTGPRLFGGDDVSAADVLGVARRRAGDAPADAMPSAADPVQAPPTGPGALSRILAPNFDPEAGERYGLARMLTRDRKETFGRGPIGDVLAPGPAGARYRLGDSEVAGRFFNGRVTPETVDAFVRAAGDRPRAVEALRDYAVSDLRAFAAPDGRLNVDRWRQWTQRNAEALRVFPELRSQLETAADAQALVDRLGARRTQALSGFERSAAGRFLGADPDKAVAAIFSGNNPTRDLSQMVRMAAREPGGVDALRRAVVDHINRRVEMPGAVDAAMNPARSPAAYRSFFRDQVGALEGSGLFTRAHVDAMAAIDEDVARSLFARDAGRGAGSNTYQNLSSAAVLSRIGFGILDPDSIPVSASAGRALSFLYRIPDQQVRELIREAMLDPKLARELVEKATPERMGYLLSALQRRIVGTVPGAALDAATPEEGRPSGRGFELQRFLEAARGGARPAEPQGRLVRTLLNER